MRHPSHKFITCLFLVGLLSLPVLASAPAEGETPSQPGPMDPDNVNHVQGQVSALAGTASQTETPSQKGPASPGTVNYIQGQVSIDNQSLGTNADGSAVLGPDQTLTTENGKAEVLLTPGVFLRVGDNSDVKMISPDLANTQLQLERGEAIVEVAEIHPANDIRIGENGSITRLLKTGLYDFNADESTVHVLRGQALVQDNDQQVKVKGDREVTLDSPKLKAKSFDEKTYESADELYRWSSLRSSYVAEANIDSAPQYYGYAGPTGWYGDGWIGAGWYWDPWFSCYTFIPGDGIFYSPFGWGFYSPFFAYDAPIYFGGHYFHRFGPNVGAWGPGPHYTPGRPGGGFHNGFHAVNGARGFGGFGGGSGFHGFHNGGPRGGFHGGGGGFHGGGFHGGGFGGRGGFHGGGFSGGGHGR